MRFSSRTLDELIRTNGSSGTFLVNDIVPGWAEFAAENLRGYALERGMPVNIHVLPGNYRKMDLPESDTAHLKHPEEAIFNPSWTPDLSLQRMADRSQTGLEVTVYEQMFRQVRKLRKQGLIIEESPGGLPYLFEEGVFSARNRRFLIAPQHQ